MLPGLDSSIHRLLTSALLCGRNSTGSLVRRFFVLCLFAAVSTICFPSQAGFVDRGVHRVAEAIGKSRPKLPLEIRKQWARWVLQTAKEVDCDPYTLVAIGWSESKWHPGAVSPDGEDFGLGQVRAKYLPGCRTDRPALRDNSSSCQRTKASLLNPHYAIRIMGRLVLQNQKFCRKKTGRKPLMRRWLSSYGGMNKPPSRYCGMQNKRGRWRDLPTRKRVKQIIDYRKMLIRTL